MMPFLRQHAVYSKQPQLDISTFPYLLILASLCISPFSKSAGHWGAMYGPGDSDSEAAYLRSLLSSVVGVSLHCFFPPAPSLPTAGSANL